MSAERSEWLEGVFAALKDSLGSNEQKARAYKAAIDMEAALPTGSKNAERFAGMLRKMFDVWVYRMIYLRPEEDPAHHLPESIHRSNVEVAVEYGLRTQKGIEEKQQQIADAADRRIQRAVEHAEAGWALEDCLCFVASKQEWRRVRQQTGQAAA